jgi:predicted RNA binding protein YcfA (HicA-like mRNA interferase family)
MPKPPRVSGKDTIRALERFGFLQIRQQGSHVILKKRTADGEIGCVVPLHRELAIGTLKSVLKQAEIDLNEFIKHL